jgi:hypothetical protein
MDLWRSPGTSKRCQTLQYAWPSGTGCIGKRMAAWNGPLVGSDSLNIDHILYGKGPYCERERSHFQFFWGLRPPPTPKDPGFVENSSSPIDWWGQIAKRRSGPPSKSYVLVRSLKCPYNIFIRYQVYIYKLRIKIILTRNKCRC